MVLLFFVTAINGALLNVKLVNRSKCLQPSKNQIYNKKPLMYAYCPLRKNSSSYDYDYTLDLTTEWKPEGFIQMLKENGYELEKCRNLLQGYKKVIEDLTKQINGK